jgi:hypothetical protein
LRQKTHYEQRNAGVSGKIAPGFIDAGMSKSFFAEPKVREKRISGVPLRSLGDASDIANAVGF